jgi:hypothetical protein
MKYPNFNVISTMLIKYIQYLIKARSLNSSRSNRILSSPKCPDQQQHPTSLLFNRCWGSFLGAKKLGHEVNHSFPSSAKVKTEWRV